MNNASTEPQIISASRRTDIPAFYHAWLLNRLRAGFCMVANPYRPSQVRRISLERDAVLGFVFWTRCTTRFAPVLNVLDQRGDPYYVLFSLTGYPQRLEKGAPETDAAVRDISALSDRIGPSRVTWRYDPIVLSDDISDDWHRRNFTSLADRLDGLVARVIVSVLDPYNKTRRRLDAVCPGITYAPPTYRALLADLAQIAAAHDMHMQSCTEPALDVPGIEQGACIEASRLTDSRAVTTRLQKHRLREGCRCDRSVDIGVNNTCGFGCRYCYATSNHERSRERVSSHDPSWNSLTGNLPETA